MFIKWMVGLLAVVVVVIIGASVALYLGLFQDHVPKSHQELPPSIESGREHQFVGHSLTSIFEKYGKPDTQWDGLFGNQEAWPRLKYWNAVTWVYRRPTGELYLSFCPQDGGRICFRSTWLPTGSSF